MIRVAVVEDEQKHAQELQLFLRRYAAEKSVDLSMEFFSNGLDFVSDYNSRFDVVFMDIEMPHMNGMECAFKLRQLDQNVALIFVTGMTQYAVKGYEVDAVGYIVKPVSYFPFSVLMDKVVARLSNVVAKEIFIQKGDYLKRISSRKLWFVEVMDHYLIYHTQEGTFREIGRMKDMETQLCDYDFFRCSNSYLINLRFVREIDEDEVTVGDEKVPISRRRKKELLLAMGKFLKRGES